MRMAAHHNNTEATSKGTLIGVGSQKATVLRIKPNSTKMVAPLIKDIGPLIFLQFHQLKLAIKIIRIVKMFEGPSPNPDKKKCDTRTKLTITKPTTPC